MQVLRRAVLAMAFTLPLAALPLSAQFYKWDFNVNGGYSWLSGDMFDRNDFDIFDDFVFDDDVFDGNLFGDNSVSLGNGGTVGAQLGYWFSKRFGIRANFAYTDSDIERRDDLLFDADIFDPILFNGFGLFDHDVNLWSGTGDVLVRLNTPRTRWDGFEWLPYVALGLGAQWINPAGSGFSVIDDIDIDLDGDLDGFIDVSGDEGIPIRCSITTVTVALPRTCAFLKEGSTLAGLIALGMDFRFAPNFALRLELADRIYEPDVVRVVQDDLFPFVFAEVGDDLGSTVNQVSLTLGANFLFGLVQPPARVVVAPPPRPAPPPPPSTEEITVCVVDPTYAGGLRLITATRNLTTGDTTVMKNGDRVQLSEAVGNIPVAANSSWYVSGAPLMIGMTPNTVNYLTVGGARTIEPNDLAFIGTINGIPVFADRLTLAPGLANLGPNTDLNQLVMRSEDARKALETVNVIYVPLQPIGCVFQALQLQPQVRKK